MVNIPMTPGIQFIESQMIDTCEVIRDTRGIYDAVNKEENDELVKRVGDVDYRI